MRSTIRLIAALFYLNAGALHALTLDEVIARHIEARGGAAKLKAIRSLRLTGKEIGGGERGGGETAWGRLQKRPGMIRVELTRQGLTAIDAFDGREGWGVEPFRGRRDAHRLASEEAKSFAQQADIDGPLVNWREKGNRVEYLGTDDVDGTPAHKLRVSLKDGDVQYVFLDTDYFLAIRVVDQRHIRGAERVTETDLGSYEQVEGVWIPFSMESGPQGGHRRNRIIVERAEANVDVDDAVFHMPPGGARAERVILPGPPAAPAAAPAAPRPPPPSAGKAPQLNASVISGLGARNIGSATMSGRISAIAAYNQDGKTIAYVGAASGGVWKSPDGGTTFKPVFDKSPVQSIGAITIDPSNSNVVWVGTGESWTRNSVSIGDGVYKSTDGGETWANMGLPHSERISHIAISPKDSSVVYVCVPGKLWSDSADRGLYKTTDGGKNWALILKGPNLSTGCAGLAMDPKDPEVLFAGLWDFRRRGWTFRSGGDGPDAPSGSGFFRTADGGKTWSELTPRTHPGIPAKPWGRVEVVIAPSDPKIVYTLIESKNSALYRSSDGGRTWEARDRSQNMVWRPFYFARLIVDPTNPERIFKPDLQLIVSEDGGRSFLMSGGRNQVPGAGSTHGDWHDLWIDPQNSKHIIGGNDGGLYISWEGGNRWWKVENLPVSQFYHVHLDSKDPYQVYGGLQDNSSWVGDSAYPGGISNARWENLFGGDGFWMVPDPSDPEAVYAESQGGHIGRVDRRLHTTRGIQPTPGYKEKLRFNWNTPIYASPSDKPALYIGTQFLFRTKDRGETWERISPDLTTNDPEKQKQELSGGITVDNSSAEAHTTIYSISESPLDSRLIWVGTDDGNLQLTRDGGRTWSNVASAVKGLPKSSWVSWVEASRFGAGIAYAAFDRHTFGDMAPWVYRTTDFGKTWTRIVGPEQGVRGYAHVVKEDLVKPELLFVGTELGLWISVDGGKAWAEFKGGDFPGVAVRDLQIHPREHDLVLATHGRGIWIVDDITPLRALTNEVLSREVAFLPGRQVQQRVGGRGGGWASGDQAFVGENPPSGAVITYYQRTRHLFGPIKLEVLDPEGRVVDSIPATKRRGLNRVSWNMQVKAPRVPRAAQTVQSASQGPRVMPGTYTVRLLKGSQSAETRFDIGLDRRAPFQVADRKQQFDAAMRVHAMFGAMTTLVDRIEGAREAAETRLKAIPPTDDLHKKLRSLANRLEEVKKKIVATKEGGAITGEERIREHTDHLYGALISWEGRPAQYQLNRIGSLQHELDDVQAEFDGLVANQVGRLNEELKLRKMDPIALAPTPEAKSTDARALAALVHCARAEWDECDLGLGSSTAVETSSADQ